MNPQITLHPIGRTGNIMFQTAAAIGYAKKYGVTWGVPSDTREVPHFHNMFPNLPRADGSYKRYMEHPHAHCDKHGMHFDECHFNYHEIPKQPNPVKLVGFFQSWKYFENAQDEVREAFKLKDYPEYRDYVSIHVRRGDYVQHAGSFPPIDNNYLLHATDVTDRLWIIGKDGLKTQAKKHLVFSDDIAWCKEYFKKYGDSFEFSEGRNEFEDLSIMASCSHHIIANSTFSWWGAYLGHNPERMIISPSCKRGNWFGMESGVKHDCIDLLPPNWHQIEFR